MTGPLHSYVLDQLQARKGTWPSIAAATGISLRTLEKIARREFDDPGVSFIERLAKYFRRQEAA